MKIRWNPIVKKDLQVTARSMRISWGLFAYEAALALAFLLVLAIIQEEADSWYSDNFYSYLVVLFPVLAVVQVCIVTLIVPIITASAISGEKERQTFDLMLTTCMTPFSIVFGKVMSAVINILLFVAASTPVMALSFVVGGMRWSYLFYFLLAILLQAVFSGSIGIFASSLCRKSIVAVLLSFAIYGGFYVLTALPPLISMIFGMGRNMGESALFLLLNPVVFFEEFFMLLMTGETMFNGTISKGDAGIVTYMLSHYNLWIYVSAGCMLLVSFLFMLMAAWKVNPLHSGTGVRKKK